MNQHKTHILQKILLSIIFIYAATPGTYAQTLRERISINEGWKFMRDTLAADSLIYDVRPTDFNRKDDIVADTRAEQQTRTLTSKNALKPWILPTANDFIKDPAKHHQRPKGSPGSDFHYVQANFSEQGWESVNLPHDWAIEGPFYKGGNVPVGGGMGRLPIQGVAWYRKKIEIPASDKGKNIYLDIDGAMSYAMVWLNGELVGGWPYGYNSFRLDLTPYLQYGKPNQLAIRLDNPVNSSRWYPGSGIYRNVWLTKVKPVHVAQWGTFIRASEVSSTFARLDLELNIDNKSANRQDVKAVTEVYALDEKHHKKAKVGTFPVKELAVSGWVRTKTESTLLLKNPALWELSSGKQPPLYVAVTRLYQGSQQIDEYETRFGIRSVEFNAEKGLLLNGKVVRIQGVNQHHDLGALGAAFNKRAAERQLELLREMGCNAIRLAHNPPAPELLDLTDSMGFLVIDEIFDCWERGKTPLDFHLIFNDWHEADLRSFIRRDRNHPSVIAWSFGNEVGEQYTAEEGAAVAQRLYNITKDEDPTRPATASMNYAKPDMPFPKVMDIISLNYQGEGIRDAPAYAHLKGIRTSPLYPAFREKFPDKMIFSSETASTLSTRGTFLFPVTGEMSAPASDSTGADPVKQQVSSYDLYTAQFGASPDKVFASLDRHPYVAGEFVWSGWDYLGEPTPYYGARSSYSGIIDLAGFKKDRFFLYQARWRPDLPMAHILPHWTWPGREGQVTPVHVYSSADEAELFLNGRSLGRKNQGAYEYRFRWDNIAYQPGKLKVITYKNGKTWAADSVLTVGKAVQLALSADRQNIRADGRDLSFITVKVTDENGLVVPEAANTITFKVEGAGTLVATDNGDPADLLSFSSARRNTLSGLALAIVRGKKDEAGRIKVTASSPGLQIAVLEVESEK